MQSNRIVKSRARNFREHAENTVFSTRRDNLLRRKPMTVSRPSAYLLIHMNINQEKARGNRCKYTEPSALVLPATDSTLGDRFAVRSG